MTMSSRVAPGFLMMLALGGLGPAPAAGQGSIGPESPLTAEAAEALGAFLAREVEQKELGGLSIALVAGDRIVWARGFGAVDAEGNAPATAETAYRVGSVSKLFTDIAAMQLVERGKLDLDAPIAEALPGLEVGGEAEGAITLRHLMAHRAGIVREPPLGHYFDASGPTLAETVMSLNDTDRVLAPGEKTKYSNVGIGAVGLAVERASGQPFAEAVRSGVLRPLGMASSDFEPSEALASRIPHALMWTYDGRTFDAPAFPFGYAPAGGLVATMPDLGRFLVALFADGDGPAGPILAPGTIEQMYTRQFDDDGRFGLGFAVGQWRGRRRVGHGGAVYGFATELAALPDEQVGVAISAARDCADVRRLADLALETLLACKEGKELPELPRTEPLPDGLARELRGRYADGDDPGRVIELLDVAGRLLLVPPQGGELLELRLPAGGDSGGGLVVDGVLVAHGPEVDRDGDALVFEGTTYRPLPDDEPPPPAPAEWEGLIGEYGWDHNVLYILEREGRLHALVEWFFLDPLEPTGDAPDTFAFPRGSLYHDETIAFERDASGRATRAVVGGSVVFDRRPIDGEDGSTFRVVPTRPVAELRPGALAASPPAEPGPLREPDLVDLTALDPTIRLDVRYATDDNFLGTPVYTSARALMQRPAAEALVRAHQSLEPLGLGLLIHDAYRPWSITRLFYDATPPESRGFVADPALGSKHNRGCAADLTLCDRQTGTPIRMVAGYDEFSDRAGAFYLGGTSRQRWYRALLRRAMEDEGFAVIRNEWWHFDYKDWRSYPIGNQPFEAID